MEHKLFVSGCECKCPHVPAFDQMISQHEAEIRRLKFEGNKDYDGMRDMQAKFIAADHELRDVKLQVRELVEALRHMEHCGPCGYDRWEECLGGQKALALLAKFKDSH